MCHTALIPFSHPKLCSCSRCDTRASLLSSCCGAPPLHVACWDISPPAMGHGTLPLHSPAVTFMSSMSQSDNSWVTFSVTDTFLYGCHPEPLFPLSKSPSSICPVCSLFSLPRVIGPLLYRTHPEPLLFFMYHVTPPLHITFTFFYPLHYGFSPPYNTLDLSPSAMFNPLISPICYRHPPVEASCDVSVPSHVT